MLMMMTYVVSNKLTSAANAIVLEYTAPILVIFFEMVLFKKRPDQFSILISGLVLMGIGIVVLDGADKGNLLGDMIALLSGVFYALTMMLNEFENSDSLTSVFLGHLFTAFLTVFCIGNLKGLSGQDFLLIAALGSLQAGLGYTLLTLGLKRCEPLTGSLVACIEPVLNPILVAIFYGEYMNTRQIAGCIIVISAIIIYNVYTIRKAKN
jgi:drug/metabolite transporter (DMT)-like permease